MRPLRSLLWPPLALLTCLLLPMTLLGTWTAEIADDPDAYVEAVGPLADDPVVQDAVADRLVALVAEQAPVLPEPTVRRTVLAVLDGPEFDRVWERANLATHERVVAILRDEGAEGQGVRDGRVGIEVGDLLTIVVEVLGVGDLVDPGDLPAAQVRLRLVDAEELERARTGYRILDAAGSWLPVAWLTGLALTLLLARRRTRALLWLGVGSALACGALVAGVGVARGGLVARTGARDAELVGAVYDVVVAGLRQDLWLATWVSLAVAAVGLVAGLVTGLVPARRAAP
ncbi:DUF305 domain-containing protein [Nocardioides donggukensis]|uniref:Integral membrane protein n=1 Tax=Nocardioides donggukensis TaxID=2774019 RepID=A0A927Q219_9ACTN|nr:hypothetical protein [Nocardioides donggukensis]MBD8870767.1 hypothetical protein [Nocardioides donggukensis]